MRRSQEQFFSPNEIRELEAEEKILAEKSSTVRSAKFKSIQDVITALKAPERLLWVRTKLSRVSSVGTQFQREISTHQAAMLLQEVYNFAATQMLQQNKLKFALDLLKKAETIGADEILEAVTNNNIACYYRRVGKLRTAVHYLEKALQIEVRHSSADVSQTHLNLCATLSQLHKHSQAMHHAHTAIIRIYEMLLPDLMGMGDINSALVQERISVLCIGYHNLAVEEEFLKQTNAVQTYRFGLRLAEQYLGKEHQISGILRRSMEAAKNIFLKDARIKKSARSNRGVTGTNFGGSRTPGKSDLRGDPDPLSMLTPRNDEEVAKPWPSEPPIAEEHTTQQAAPDRGDVIINDSAGDTAGDPMLDSELDGDDDDFHGMREPFRPSELDEYTIPTYPGGTDDGGDGAASTKINTSDDGAWAKDTDKDKCITATTGASHTFGIDTHSTMDFSASCNTTQTVEDQKRPQSSTNNDKVLGESLKEIERQQKEGNSRPTSKYPSEPPDMNEENVEVESPSLFSEQQPLRLRLNMAVEYEGGAADSQEPTDRGVMPTLSGTITDSFGNESEIGDAVPPKMLSPMKEVSSPTKEEPAEPLPTKEEEEPSLVRSAEEEEYDESFEKESN